MPKTTFLFTAAALAAVLLTLGSGDPVSAAPRYKGGDVANGGTVRGVVKIDPVPAVAPFVIQKDGDTCGSKKANFRLKVDTETKGVKDVVVYIDGIAAGKRLPRKQEFMIDQVGCEYVPFVSVVPKRSKVSFKSSDAILHNVHVFGGTPDQPHAMSGDVMNEAFKDSGAPPSAIEKKFLRKSGFYYARCDAGHTWMAAYIWVVDHPYYVVTDAKGAFELTDVPAGRYTLRYWHCGWEAKPVMKDGAVSEYQYGKPVQGTAEVVVKAGEATIHNWTISGK